MPDERSGEISPGENAISGKRSAAFAWNGSNFVERVQDAKPKPAAQSAAGGTEGSVKGLKRGNNNCVLPPNGQNMLKNTLAGLPFSGMSGNILPLKRYCQKFFAQYYLHLGGEHDIIYP